MFRNDTATAISALPAPGALGTPGFFTGGDPASGVPATVVSADWLNAVQEELVAILADRGLTPDKTNRTQVLAAIRLLIADAIGTVQTVSGAVSLTAAAHWSTFIASAAAAIGLPARNTVPISWRVLLRARGGNIVLTPAGADTIDGAAIAFTLPRGSSVTVVADDQGGWTLLHEACPPTGVFVSANFSAAPGHVYHVDTSANPVVATLPASPAIGETIRFVDTNRTFGVNAFTMARNGKTIMLAAEDMVADVNDLDFMIRWSGSDWRLV